MWCCLFGVLFVFLIYLLSSFGTILPRNTFPCLSSAFSTARFVLSLSDKCGCCMLLAIRHPPLYSTTQQEIKPNPPETRKRMLKSEEQTQRPIHGAQCQTRRLTLLPFPTQHASHYVSKLRSSVLIPAHTHAPSAGTQATQPALSELRWKQT